MAGVGFFVDSGAVALTASTAKTVEQIIAATNQRALIKRLDISSNGITPTDPGILIDILTQTNAGAMSSLTPQKLTSSDSESLQTTAQKTATVEPAAGNVLASFYYNEQTWVPMLFDPPLPIVGGTRMGIRATPGTLTAATNIAITATCEE
jgi:hypothetical protein